MQKAINKAHYENYIYALKYHFKEETTFDFIETDHLLIRSSFIPIKIESNSCKTDLLYSSQQLVEIF